MPFAQFTDDWAAEKVLFQYVNGGNCSCCGVSISAKMGELYEQCSDLSENPTQLDEEESPWPTFLLSEVWEDKVKIRQRLKAESVRYAAFWREHRAAFCAFWRALPLSSKRALFALPQEQLHAMIAEESDFKEAYRVLMLTLCEQLRNFAATLYVGDGVSDSEVEFEAALFVKRGKTTFLMRDEYLSLREPHVRDDDDDDDVSGNGVGGDKDDVGAGFLTRFAELCGPKLLQRRQRKDDDDDDDVGDEKGAGGGGDGGNGGDSKGVDEDAPVTKKKGGLGAALLFKSDRRLLRVMIYRFYAANVMRKFKKTLPPQSSEAAETTTITTTTTTTTTTAATTDGVSTAVPTDTAAVATGDDIDGDVDVDGDNDGDSDVDETAEQRAARYAGVEAAIQKEEAVAKVKEEEERKRNEMFHSLVI
jgi:hypothetical protein